MRMRTGYIGVFCVLISCRANAAQEAKPQLDKIAEVEALASLTQPVAPPTLSQQPKDDYPIVLLHGMAGFIQWGPFEYFAGIPQALREHGHEVFLCEVAPYQPIPVRAKECGQQIDAFLKRSGHRRVHLISHSHGGLDGRYMISTLGYGDRIASLTTITTPHRGSLLIDASGAMIPMQVQKMLTTSLDFMTELTRKKPANLFRQLEMLSAAYMREEFNPANPNDPRVQYYSIGGRTQLSPFVNWQEQDILTLSLWPTYIGIYFLEGENDGVVPLSSSKWGTYLGTLEADHLDQIGIFELWPTRTYNRILFFQELADFLSGQGPPPNIPPK
jgi:triacylglycerol lipase